MKLISSPVTITAEGIAGSGRTLILTIIQKALIDAGFTSVIYHSEETPDTEERFRLVDEVVEQNNPDFFTKSITLVEKHKPRENVETPEIKQKHRMTQNQYNDYEVASHGGPTVRANWEKLKLDPGIEIIPESERDPFGIGDLSAMFMYPHEINMLDLTKFSKTD